MRHSDWRTGLHEHVCGDVMHWVALNKPQSSPELCRMLELALAVPHGCTTTNIATPVYSDFDIQPR